ncbi:MAG TPA: Fic family protein [Candidatus Saccharimonadales bacterium]
MAIAYVLHVFYTRAMDNFYHIRQPDYTSIDFTELYTKYREHRDEIRKYIESINQPRYLPWEKARFKKPPAGFSPEEAWYLARDTRRNTSQPIWIKAQNDELFSWNRLQYTDQYLNEFDLLMGGQFMSSNVRINPVEQQSFLTRGVIEEAIASSQLEGANVTRKVAKEMLAESRTPRNKSEWMIHNNYLMMTKITETYKDVPLSHELLLEMHRLVSTNTMDEEDIGRFRTDKDPIRVGSETQTTYIPPTEDFMLEELDVLIGIANDSDPAHFMHPIIKAILLHFWIGYLHPFVDGNGRIARALFYWLLLKKNYWLATYIPISTVIKRAPMQYSDAYVYSEQDGNDFTYFYDYHMQKIKQALNEFLGYIDKQRAENAEIDRILETRGRLNERQKQIMHYLLSNQRHSVSVTTHSSLNRISLNTARTDLLELQRLGLVFTLRQGKYVHYYAKPRS